MQLSTVVEIVTAGNEVLKRYALVRTSDEQALLRQAYARAESEGLAPALIDQCAFRVRRTLRSGLHETTPGYRTYPAPRRRAGQA